MKTTLLTASLSLALLTLPAPGEIIIEGGEILIEGNSIKVTGGTVRITGTSQIDLDGVRLSGAPDLVAEVKRFEGFSATPYTCPGGARTIGYGFTDPDIVNRGRISRAEADKILKAELEKVREAVRETVSVALTPHQEAALVSFTYNLGPGGLKRLVTGKGRLNSGNYKSVERLLPLYRRAGGQVRAGLVKRRARELAMWRGE